MGTKFQKKTKRELWDGILKTSINLKAPKDNGFPVKYSQTNIEL